MKWRKHLVAWGAALLCAATLLPLISLPQARAADVDWAARFAITQKEIEKTKTITNDLIADTDAIVKAGTLPKAQKEKIDSEIKAYLTDLKGNYTSLIHTMPNAMYSDDFYAALPNITEEQTYAHYTAAYDTAYRDYAVCALFYTNGWKDLTASVAAAFAANPGKTSCTMDGVKLVRTGSCYGISLAAVKAYTIANPPVDEDAFTLDSTYGYTVIKIVSPSGRTYAATGFSGISGSKAGYCFPTVNGLGMYANGKKYVLDASQRKGTTAGEQYLLDGILEKYRNQGKKTLTYKGVTVTRSGDRYVITVSNTVDKQVGSGYGILTLGDYGQSSLACAGCTTKAPAVQYAFNLTACKNIAFNGSSCTFVWKGCPVKIVAK